MINIGLSGATGKMGEKIIKQIENFPTCKVSGKFNSANNQAQLELLCKNSDVIIDFSNPSTLEELLQYALIHKTKLVIGTTGYNNAQIEDIKKAANILPILYSANMSLGAHLISHLAVKSAKVLKESYDVEIIETHHRAKRDAPSGTALMIAEALAKAKDLNLEKCMVLNRVNKFKKNNEIGISSVRGGQIFGDHEILFLGDDEIITIKHQALNRNSFANGAIRAAKWLIDKEAGLYGMSDIVEF